MARGTSGKIHFKNRRPETGLKLWLLKDHDVLFNAKNHFLSRLAHGGGCVTEKL